MRRFALRKVLRNVELAAELGAKTFVLWGGREGAEYDSAKDIGAALDRYREAMDLLCGFVLDRGFDLRFAIEPKPNEPRGDILLPTVGHALAFIEKLAHPELVGVNPEVGHEQMSNLNYGARRGAGAVGGQALPHRPQRPARPRVRPGPGVRPRRPVQRVLAGRPAGDAGYEGPRHFDYKPSRTEDITGVWASAAANMRTYLLLKERAAAFRADPEVAEALAVAGVADLAEPTLNPGETYTDLMADRSAFEDFTPDTAGARGYGSCACTNSRWST